MHTSSVNQSWSHPYLIMIIHFDHQVLYLLYCLIYEKSLSIWRQFLYTNMSCIITLFTFTFSVKSAAQTTMIYISKQKYDNVLQWQYHNWKELKTFWKTMKLLIIQYRLISPFFTMFSKVVCCKKSEMSEITLFSFITALENYIIIKNLKKSLIPIWKHCQKRIIC